MGYFSIRKSQNKFNSLTLTITREEYALAKSIYFLLWSLVMCSMRFRSNRGSRELYLTSVSQKQLGETLWFYLPKEKNVITRPQTPLPLMCAVTHGKVLPIHVWFIFFYIILTIFKFPRFSDSRKLVTYFSMEFFHQKIVPLKSSGFYFCGILKRKKALKSSFQEG